MKWLLAKCRSLLKRTSQPAPKRWRLSVAEAGLSGQADDGESWSLHWDEVTRVATYKVDLFSVDMICLDFFIGSQDQLRHTDDEMPGFSDLCNALRGHYPSISESWWFDVAFPAFETNFKILYEAPSPET